MSQYGSFLAIGAFGILGEWLIGKPKHNFQAMPQINQSLRGSTIPVTFGTNRVAAQVVWQKNFKAVRAGGKKGGGSGGAGAAKGGGSQGYNYFMDLIFHYGIVDKPSYVSRAWIGQDPLDKKQVEQLDAGLVGTNWSLISSAYTSTSSLTGTITFTEAFTAPGYPTGSASLESWSYFGTQQDNLQCQWPSTFWLGFRGFSLGMSAQISQLGCELTPLNASGQQFVVNQADLPLSGITGAIWVQPPTNSGIVVDANNIPYKLVQTFSGGGGYYLVECDNAALSSQITGNTQLLACNGSAFLLGITATPVSTTYNVTFNVYQVNSISNIALIGTVTLPTLGLGWCQGILGTYFDGNNLIVLAQFSPSLGNSARLVTYKIPVFDIAVSSAGGAVHVDDWLLDSNVMSNANYQGSDGLHDFTNAFTNLPMAPTPDGKVLLYVGQGDYTYIVANATSSTTGWNTLLGVISGPSLVTLAGNVFSAVANPWHDAGKNLAGSATGNAYDDYRTFNFDPFGNLCVARSYTSSADRNTKGNLGTYSRFTNYTWPGLVAVTDISVPLFNLSLSTITHNYPFVLENAVWGGAAQYVWFGDPTVLPTQGYAFGQTVSWGVNSLDVTPAYIIYQILTNQIYGFNTGALFGLQLNAGAVNTASYNDAQQFCVDNGIMISVTYNGQESVLNTINELLSLYNGYLTVYNGQIYFGVLRNTDVPMRTIDNTHLISPGPGKPPVDVTKAALQDTYNSIEVQFLDRSLEYNQNAVWVTDEVDYDFNGPRIKSYQAKFVMTQSTAQLIAERALWNNLYGRDNYAFKLGVKDADLRPGNIITLIDSFDNTLNGGVQAIITEWQESRRLEFTVKATRVYNDQLTAGHGPTNQSSPGQGLGSMVDAVQPPIAMRAYELPQRFHVSAPFLFFGYNQQDQVMGAQLWTSPDGATFKRSLDCQPFPISGILATPLPLRPNGFVENNIDIYLMPTSSFNASSPTYVQTHDLEDTTVAARQNGLTCIIVGSEAIACEGAILRAQNHYTISKMYRGWGGTPIAAQNSGSYWNNHGDGEFEFPIAATNIGQTIFYKILPYNFAGNMCDISSVNAQTYTIKGDYWLPSKQPETRYFVNSAGSWSANTPIVGPNIGVVSGGCDVILQWRAAANEEGWGFGASGNGGAGHFVADVATPSYRVDVASSNGTKVSSFFVNTGYFDYTLAQNSADFVGVARSLIFTVTPYNNLGDGYAPFTSSIQLDW